MAAEAVQLPDVLRDDVGYLLHRAALLVHALTPDALPDGRPLREWAVLAGAVGGAGASQRELGAELQINRTIVGRAVDVLVADGLLARARDPRDRRAWVVSATAAGRTTLAATQPALAEADARYCARLIPAERDRLRARLDTLLTGCLGPRDGALRGRVAYLVTRAHKRVRARAQTAVAPFGIDIRHFCTLTELAAGTVESQQALARASGQPAPVIVGIVDELEAAGLARRAPHPDDRRVRCVAITPAGRRAQPAAAAALAEVHGELAQTTGAAGYAELAWLLQGLLGAERRPAGPTLRIA